MEFMINTPEYQPKDDHIRVATAMPEVAIGDVETNVNNISKFDVQPKWNRA